MSGKEESHSAVRTIMLIPFYLALQTAGWGLWLVVFQSSFSSSPTFDAMASIASRYTWGGWMIALGIVTMAGLFSHRKTPVALCLYLMTATWVFITVQFASSNVASPGVWANAQRAGYSALVLIVDYSNGFFSHKS